MTGFVDFMRSTWGRLLRIVLGLALITYGLAVLGDTTGLVLAAVGAVPLALGYSGHCVLDPFVGRQTRTS